MPNKKGITIGKTRSILYKTAKFLGDINSIKRGTIGSRVTTRVVGKLSGRASSSISRGIMGFFKK